MTTAIELHWDFSVRDCYGVLTVPYLHELKFMAEMYRAGWEAHRDVMAQQFAPYKDDITKPMRYADLRDVILKEVDVPYEVACMIALWLTRDEGNIDGYFLHFPELL